MQWISTHVEQYFKNPEYFDTAIIPCYRIDLNSCDVEHVKVNEQMMNRLMQLEERLRGRIMLFPAIVFYDLNREQIQQTIEITANVLRQFKYVFYVPFDEPLFDLMKTCMYKDNEDLLSQEGDWYQHVLSFWNK